MANVYLIVTDYHRLFKMKTDNRIDYRKEIEHIDQQLFSIAEKYKNYGHSIKFLFLGDIYHRQYNEPINAIIDNNIFVYLASKYGECYSVLGNHEISYYRNNPFYTLFSSINSEKLKHLSNRVIKPTGLLQILNVVDRLEDGEVIFHFNHYGCPDNSPIPGKINIGLYHKEYVSREIVDDMKSTFNNSNWITEYHAVDSESIFRGYDYCFLGHLHKVYGSYTIQFEDTNEKVILTYLGSLGRPNHLEVQDNFLERNIPAVIVDNGRFAGIESNMIKLLPRDLCIDDKVIEIQKENYEMVKSMRNSIDYVPISDDPLLNLYAACGDDPLKHNIIKELLDNDLDSVGEMLENKCNKVLGGRYGFKTT